jgi:hypothetical protein
MKPALVLEIARDFAEAIRANPYAVRDVQEILEALALTHADLVSADVPEADLRELVAALFKVDPTRPKLSRRFPPAGTQVESTNSGG